MRNDIVVPAKPVRKEQVVRLICRCGREHAMHMGQSLPGNCKGWLGDSVEVEEHA